MKRPKKRGFRDDVYMPQVEFREYLDKRLHHETLYRKKIDAGAKLSEEEERERNELHRMKNHWLNKCVFPSMANLTVFLEYMEKSEELREVFKDDLKELFLGRNIDSKKKEWKQISDDPMPDHKKREAMIVFQRFIQAAIKCNWSKKENANDFRLVLIACMESVLFQHFNHIGPYLLGPTANYTVSQDSSRVLAWAETLARNVDVEDVDDADRPVRF